MEEILSLSSHYSSYSSEPSSEPDTPNESRSKSERRAEPRFPKALSKMDASATLATRKVTGLIRLVDSLLDFSKFEGGKMNRWFRLVYIGGFMVDLASSGVSWRGVVLR